MKTVTIRNKADDVVEILLYDVIGEDFFGGVSAKTFAEQLKAVKAKTINLRINSPGGAVFDGLAMYESLLRHKARVEVDIDGLAGSIASVIAMAGDEIRIAETGFMMVHEPFSGVVGTAADMRHEAELLDKARDQIVAAYRKRTKRKEEELLGLVAAETWFTGAEAVEAGFADRLTESQRAAAVDFGRMAACCRNVPEALKNPPAPDPAAVEAHRARREWLDKVLAKP